MDHATIVIRPAVPGDTPGLVMLVGELGYPTDGPEMLDRLNRLGNHPDYTLRVACKGDEVVGLVALQYCLILESNDTLLRIMALAVARRYRYKGIGGMLLHEVDKVAMSRGVQSIFFNFDSYPDRKEARDFCQKKGYIPRSMALVKKLTGTTKPRR